MTPGNSKNPLQEMIVMIVATRLMILSVSIFISNYYLTSVIITYPTMMKLDTLYLT